jgi:hypothetical protein
MERYKNLNGGSNVVAYELGVDSITVQFKSGTWRHYVYNANRPGAAIVSELQRLAVAGAGLNSYISRSVKKNFDNKY